jgi:hypothetical protein
LLDLSIAAPDRRVDRALQELSGVVICVPRLAGLDQPFQGLNEFRPALRNWRLRMSSARCDMDQERGRKQTEHADMGALHLGCARNKCSTGAANETAGFVTDARHWQP